LARARSLACSIVIGGGLVPASRSSRHGSLASRRSDPACKRRFLSGVRPRYRKGEYCRNRWFADSLVEGDGFEPSVPRPEGCVETELQSRICPRLLARGMRFAEDSPLEGAGFEPSVPLLRKASRLLPKGDAGPISWMGSLSTSRLARRRCSAAGPLSTAVSFSAGPMVRIRFPPAASLSQQ
jgi:hypothetical protein